MRHLRTPALFAILLLVAAYSAVQARLGSAGGNVYTQVIYLGSGEDVAIENSGTGVVRLYDPTGDDWTTVASTTTCTLLVDANDAFALRTNSTATDCLTVAETVLTPNGVVRGADGASSAPTYSFTSDPDSGLYVDASALRFAFGGATAFQVSGSAAWTTGELYAWKTTVTNDTDGETLNATTHRQRAWTNAGASGPITFTLPDAAAGHGYTFVVVAAQELRIDPQAGDNFIGATPGAMAAGEYYYSSTAGSTIKIVAINSDSWQILYESGLWAQETP